MFNFVIECIKKGKEKRPGNVYTFTIFLLREKSEILMNEELFDILIAKRFNIRRSLFIITLLKTLS